MTRTKVFVKRVVWAIIDEMPIGSEFTTQDFMGKVKYGYTTTRSIALAIRKHPHIININEKGVAVWRRVE